MRIGKQARLSLVPEGTGGMRKAREWPGRHLRPIVVLKSTNRAGSPHSALALQPLGERDCCFMSERPGAHAVGDQYDNGHDASHEHLHVCREGTTHKEWKLVEARGGGCEALFATAEPRPQPQSATARKRWSRPDSMSRAHGEMSRREKWACSTQAVGGLRTKCELGRHSQHAGAVTSSHCPRCPMWN